MSSIGSQSSGSHVGGGATPTSARSEIGFGGNNTQPPTEASRPRTQKEEDEEAFKELVRFPVLPREYQLFLGHTSISNHLGKNEYFQFFLPTLFTGVSILLDSMIKRCVNFIIRIQIFLNIGSAPIFFCYLLLCTPPFAGLRLKTYR